MSCPEASVNEFQQQYSKMSDYLQIDGEDTIVAIGPYIIELYKNVRSRYGSREFDGERQGFITIHKKENDGYNQVANNVFETLDDAMSEYTAIINASHPEQRIRDFAKRN